MSTFITRVELHGTSHQEQPYQILHAAMIQEGFTKTIKGDDGSVYYLPTAEYLLKVTENPRGDVYAAAQRAASKTGKTFWIIVTQSAGMTFLLKEVAKVN
jgi:hypothetical protein